LNGLLQAVVAHRDHALLGGEACDVAHVAALQDEIADLVGHHQDLEDREAAGIAGAAAAVAADRLVERNLAVVREAVEAPALDDLVDRCVFLAALGAERAHQALRLDRRDGGVGVQCRQHEVAGQRRLHRDLRRLGVAHLADHNDVGVLPDNRSERVRKGETNFRFHLHLIDSPNVVLYRILDRDDHALGLVEVR
jgi:hypothetical protein